MARSLYCRRQAVAPTTYLPTLEWAPVEANSFMDAQDM